MLMRSGVGHTVIRRSSMSILEERTVVGVVVARFGVLVVEGAAAYDAEVAGAEEAACFGIGGGAVAWVFVAAETRRIEGELLVLVAGTLAVGALLLEEEGTRVAERGVLEGREGGVEGLVAGFTVFGRFQPGFLRGASVVLDWHF